VESNIRDGIEVSQPLSFEGRRALARECAARLGLTAPVLLDGMDNGADRAYGAWPERLYVLSAEGKIVYQGGKGPYGFKPEELERFLAETL
jgi:hypothetical protein